MATSPATETQPETQTARVRGEHPGRVEHRVFLVAVALVAVHVVDDNIVQPQPGTSPADHVVSTVVPLLVLLAAAFAFGRVRAGWRAVLAICLGFLGVVSGWIEAGYYTVARGPSGDDYTGLLAGAAGAVLLGLGAVILWRSRRLDDRRAWRYLRRTLLGFAGVVVLYQVGLAVSVSYMATHVQAARVPPPNLGAAHDEVTLTTSDGLKLHGWYVPSTNGAAVLVYAGRTKTQGHARMLARHGYGVLLIDRRGEGASDGDGNMFGWGGGEEDIHAAVDFLREQSDVDPGRVAGIGLSVGGELMLQAAATSDDLAAVVSEGAGTRSFAEEREELPGPGNWFDYPLYAVKEGAMTVLSNSGPPPKLTDLVPGIAPRPVLLIWAPNGGNAETMNPVYHRLAGENALIWEMPDAQHIRGIVARPEEYERRVVGFLDDALLRR